MTIYVFEKPIMDLVEIGTNINIPNGTILDGEITVPGPGGKPDFE